MSQVVRQVSASDGEVLDAIAEFVGANFAKTDIERGPSSVIVRKKVLWQKQEAVFEVSNGTLTASGNCQDSDKVVRQTLEGMTPLLDDHGWSAAAEKLGIRSMNKNGRARNKILSELMPGEEIIAATTGFLDKKPTVLAATNRRIIMIAKDIVGWEGATQTIPFDKISGVSEKSGFATGAIRITTSNDDITVDTIANDELKAFVSAVRRTMSAPADSPAPVQPAASSGGNAEELKNLAELHAAGVLTDEEFTAAKARILGI